MPHSKTTLALPLVAVLLVVAAGAVMATSGNPASAPVVAPAAASPSPTPAPSDRVKAPTAGDALTQVLDDLVAKGTITAAQKKAILDGVTTEREARQAARKAAREQARADRKQIRDFLADGVITKEEFDKLPAKSPLRTLTTLLDDGKITTDELKALGKGWNGLLGNGGKGNGGGMGNGHGWGKGGNPNKAAPSASPTTGG